MTLQIDKGNRTSSWTVAVRGRNEDGQEVAFHSLHEAGRQGFEPSCIRACLNGKQKHHAGYKWEVVSRAGPKVKGPCRLRQVAYLRNTMHRTNLEMADDLGLAITRVNALTNLARAAGLMKYSGHDIRRIRREAGTL